MADTEDHVLTEMRIAAPVASVWEALREPDEIGKWFGWESESLADEIRFIFIDNATPDEARHVLQFGGWQGVADRFELSEDGRHTLLRIVRHGPVPEGGWGAAYDDVQEGWISFAQQLRFHLERHAGAQRRTLWLSDKAGPGTIGALGLTGVGEAGSHYSHELPTGERIVGEVWHWSRHQLGVTVTDWGDGLLIVADRTDGGGTALLTVHGMEQAAFDALQQRWTDWWGAVHPPG